MPVALPIAYPRAVTKARQPSAWLALYLLLMIFSLALGMRYPLVADEMVALEATSGL